jgi:hypothetical protein
LSSVVEGRWSRWLLGVRSRWTARPSSSTAAICSARVAVHKPSRQLVVVPAVFAAVAGVALALWWGATLLGILPPKLQPVQQQPSHVVAESALAVALLCGAWLDLRNARSGRLVLSAALGALAYASVNVVGDFSRSPSMTLLLIITVLLTLLALIVGTLTAGAGADRAGS